jgi:hypothetical protein
LGTIGIAGGARLKLRENILAAGRRRLAEGIPALQGEGGRQPAELTLGAGGTLSTSAAKRSGIASGAGIGACFGGTDCFGASGCFGAAALFGVATRFRAPTRVGVTALGFRGAARCGARFDVLVDDALGFEALGFEASGFEALGFETLGFEALRFDGLGFDGLAFDSVGRKALARTFVPTVAFRGTVALCARTCSAAWAAFAFFLACLAAFLLAFANFRARLSMLLAARTCCFAASARATAAAASAFSRCAAAAWFVRASDDREVATTPCLPK